MNFRNQLKLSNIMPVVVESSGFLQWNNLSKLLFTSPEALNVAHQICISICIALCHFIWRRALFQDISGCCWNKRCRKVSGKSNVSAQFHNALTQFFQDFEAGWRKLAQWASGRGLWPQVSLKISFVVHTLCVYLNKPKNLQLLLFWSSVRVKATNSLDLFVW